MRYAKYIHPVANGLWKYRKGIPIRHRNLLGRRELKFTILANDAFQATQIAMMICQNYEQAIDSWQNDDMAKSNLPSDLSVMQLVTVGGLTKNKKGQVTIKNLSYDKNSEKDKAEILQMLGIEAEPAKPVYSNPQEPPFLLSQALELNRTKRNLSPATLKKIERVYQLAFAVIGDIDLNADDAKSKMTDLVAAAKLEPLRRTQNKDLVGLTFVQQIKYADKHKLQRVSLATVENLLNILSSSIEATQNLDSKLKRNPLSYKQTGLVVGKGGGKNGRANNSVGFNSAEIAILFDPVNLATIKMPAVLIGALIGLNTGMRVNEVASLRPEHIVNHHGLDCFDLSSWAVGIIPANQGQSCLKTAASQRIIPLSQGLLDAGLLDYVRLVKASGQKLLFPNMSWNEVDGFGRNLSRNFVKYRRRLGVVDGKDFHEFRGHLNDAMKQLGAPQEFREDFFGHTNSSMNSRNYTNATVVQNLKHMVDAVSLPKMKINTFFSDAQLRWYLSSH